MIEILFVIYTLIWIYYTAKVDAEHISRGQYITTHLSRWLSRSMVAVLLSIFSIKAGLILGLLFWTFFDSFLNKIRDLPLFYLGETAKTDRFFTKLQWLFITSKVISFIIAVVILIVYGL